MYNHDDPDEIVLRVDGDTHSAAASVPPASADAAATDAAEELSPLPAGTVVSLTLPPLPVLPEEDATSLSAVSAPAAGVKLSPWGRAVSVITILFLMLGVILIGLGAGQAQSCSRSEATVDDAGVTIEDPSFVTCANEASYKIIPGAICFFAGVMLAFVTCSACAHVACFRDDEGDGDKEDFDSPAAILVAAAAIESAGSASAVAWGSRRPTRMQSPSILATLSSPSMARSSVTEL